MIRLVFVVFVPAIMLAVLLHVSVWVFVIPAAIIAVLAYTVGGQRFKCPACRKRIKIGATRCHHCGQNVGRSAQKS